MKIGAVVADSLKTGEVCSGMISSRSLLVNGSSIYLHFIVFTCCLLKKWFFWISTHLSYERLLRVQSVMWAMERLAAFINTLKLLTAHRDKSGILVFILMFRRTKCKMMFFHYVSLSAVLCYKSLQKRYFVIKQVNTIRFRLF